MTTSRVVGRYRVTGWTDNLFPFRAWGVEFYHHPNVAIGRDGAEVGVYLYLGRYRALGSIAKLRVTR